MAAPRRENNSPRRALSWSGVRLVSICPPTVKEMAPVCSETSTTTASDSSVTPIAARWRVPRCLEIAGFSEQGGTGPEDCEEQVVGKFRVEGNPAFDVSPQTRFAFDNDESADAVLRKIFGGHHDVVIQGFGVVRGKFQDGKIPPDARQRAPDFRLEQDDQGDRHVGQKRGQQPLDHLQSRPLRAAVKQHQQSDGHQHLHGARALQQLQHIVNQHRDNQDVERPSGVEPLQGAHRQCSSEHYQCSYGIAGVPLRASGGLRVPAPVVS
jgi:hypothetical protein